jgi:hypothetical protein
MADAQLDGTAAVRIKRGEAWAHLAPEEIAAEIERAYR